MCSENSGLRLAISELVQRSGKALLHGVELCRESLGLRLGRLDWMPARYELCVAMALGEYADSGGMVGESGTDPQSKFRYLR